MPCQFNGVLPIPLYPHSNVPFPYNSEFVNGFRANCASQPVFINHDGNYTASGTANTSYWGGTVVPLYPTLGTQGRTKRWYFNSPGVWGTIVPLGEMFARGVLFNFSQWNGLRTPYGASVRIETRPTADQVAKQPMLYTQTAMPILSNMASQTYKYPRGNDAAWEATAFGQSYGMLPFVNSFASPSQWAVTLFNNSLYPNIGIVNDVTQLQNAYQQIVPIGTSIGLRGSEAYTNSIGGNAPDYKTGWNYMLTANNYFPVGIMKWRALRPTGGGIGGMWPGDGIVDSFVQLNSGNMTGPVQTTNLHAQQTISTTFGFFFRMRASVTYNGKVFWHIFMSKDGSGYWLVDWLFQFSSNALDATLTGVGNKTAGNADVMNGHIDRYGNAYAVYPDPGATWKGMFTGWSQAPISQIVSPQLQSTSNIPTVKLGCVDPCSSFMTFDSGK